MRQISTLTQIDAEIAAEACRARASELGVAVTIAVVDASAALLTLIRMDGARAFSVDLASRKAKTAASIGVDTSQLQKLADPGLSGELLAIPGGLPVSNDGVPAGGIGVSGALPDLDASIAQAGVSVILRSKS